MIKDPSTGKDLTLKAAITIAASSMVGFYAGLWALRVMRKFTGD